MLRCILEYFVSHRFRSLTCHLGWLCQTNLSNFTGTTYRNVSRSYYEFQQFYDAIIHSTPQTIIPALPLAQTSAPTDEEDDRLVKIMLQRWLTRVCEDPILITEEEVRSFIESDFGYQPTPVTRKKTSSGFSLIRRSVPDEDEELLQARFELTKLETQFFEAAKAIDKLSKVRKSKCYTPRRDVDIHAVIKHLAVYVQK